jgi:hypothetical protein
MAMQSKSAINKMFSNFSGYESDEMLSLDAEMAENAKNWKLYNEIKNIGPEYGRGFYDSNGRATGDPKWQDKKPESNKFIDLADDFKQRKEEKAATNPGYKKPENFLLKWGQNMLIDGLLSLIDKRELSNPAVTGFIAAAMTLVEAGQWTEFMAVVSGLAIYRNYDRITTENLYALLPDSDVSKWKGPSSWFGYDSNQSIRRRRRSTRQRRRRRTAHRRR